MPWMYLKNVLATKNIADVQWADLGDRYWICLQDGAFLAEALLPKTQPASADQIAFESQYKKAENEKFKTV